MHCSKLTPKSISPVKKSLADLIRDYKKSLNPSCIGDTSMYGDLNEVLSLKGTVSIDEFLKRCVCNRKRHQWCLSNDAVKNAVKKLLRSSVVSRKGWNSFEELYDNIYALIGKGNTGISNCTVYDTAIRIGWTLSPRIEPKDYIYVHRKVIKSAKHIFKKHSLKAPIMNSCRIERRFFDSIETLFKSMSALEIEDFLCVYHDRIMKL